MLLMGLTKTEPIKKLVFGKNLPLRGWRILLMKKKYSVEQIVGVTESIDW